MTARQRKKVATASERRVAAELGGRRTPLSGSGLEKADGRVKGVFRIENKTTAKTYYSLSSKDWAKLRDVAVAAGEQPVFHVRMASKVVGFYETVVLDLGYYLSLTGESHPALVPCGKTLRLVPDCHGALSACISFVHPLRGRLDYCLVALPYHHFLKLVEP